MKASIAMTSRRNFLKGSAGAMGIAVVPMVVGHGDALSPQWTAEERAQSAYLEAVLQKHAGRSRKLGMAKIRLFAQRFTETYGVVDYKSLFGGVAGEYRLTRLFVRSTKLPA